MPIASDPVSCGPRSKGRKRKKRKKEPILIQVTFPFHTRLLPTTTTPLLRPPYCFIIPGLVLLLRTYIESHSGPFVSKPIQSPELYPSFSLLFSSLLVSPLSPCNIPDRHSHATCMYCTDLLRRGKCRGWYHARHRTVPWNCGSKRRE